MDNRFVKILHDSGMNMTGFGQHFNIPYPTLQKWKSGERKAPAYVLDLIEYKLDVEKRKRYIVQYELRRNNGEFRQQDVKEGCTTEQTNQVPKIISIFKDKAEALRALTAYTTDIYSFNTAAGRYYSVEEYYVEENTYDEDGEWIEGGDIWRFSKMPTEWDSSKENQNE